MKFQYQRIIIIFLLIVIAALSLKSCFRKERKNVELRSIVRIERDSATYWKDRYDREHAQVRLSEADMASLRTVYNVEIDSLRRTLGIKEQMIQSIVMSSTTSSRRIEPRVDTVFIDSNKVFKLHFADKWLTVDGLIGPKSYLDYMFTDSLVFTTYRKKVGLFKRATFLDGYSLNPNVHITNLKGLRVSKENTSRIGIGPYVGYGFNGSTWSPNIGVSVHYTLIKL